MSVHSKESVVSSVSTGQTIKILATQLPDFGRTEDEDVDIWLQKIESVANIHGVSQEVTLVVTNKLVKQAHCWFDLCTESINRSWPCFKDTVI